MFPDQSAPNILRLLNRPFIRHDHNGGSPELFAGPQIEFSILNSGPDRNTAFITGYFAVPLTGPANSNDIAFPLLMHIEERRIATGR